MVQPQYSPEEALNKIKLMMGYDLSKTLKENVSETKGLIKEDDIDTDTEKSVQKILGYCSSRPEAEGTLDAASIASSFNRAFRYQTGGFMGGTDDTLWRAQAAKMKKGNMDDLCNVNREFEDAGYGNFAQSIVDELDDEEIAELMETFTTMKYRTDKATKLAVTSTEQTNINWFKKTFPCIFESDGNVDQQIRKNANNYVYILIKGTSGKQYQVFQDGRVKKTDGTATGKKISCNGSRVTFISESVKKKILDEQIDDSELTGTSKKTVTTPPKSNVKSTPKSTGLEKGATTSPGDPYQYKFVEGQWWSKGLLPAGVAKLPNWVSLKNNSNATDILNKRYPTLITSKAEVKVDTNIEDVDGEDPNKI